MIDLYLKKFESISRRVHLYTDEEVTLEQLQHPFEIHNIHTSLPNIVLELFDNGHYSQSTFEAYKFLDKEISRISKVRESGFKLMMQVFSESNPKIKLTALSSDSEIDEQKGYQFIFAGSMMAIRNPRGHEYKIKDTMDDCLDHLSLVSLLIRRLEKSGLIVGT